MLLRFVKLHGWIVNMNCTDPIFALVLGKELDTPFYNGKYQLKLIGKKDSPKLAGLMTTHDPNEFIPLPCGKCLACRTNYVKDWSVRCMLEASMYRYNYFVTLTYDDLHINTSSTRKDFRDFMKVLWSSFPGVRYFACCEKGSTTHRVHFHAILFNCPIPDLKFIGRRNGNPVYNSDFISKAWSKGLIDIGDVSMASCQYVAGYVMKKLREKDPEEYVLMSTHPGLGAAYLEKHFEVIYETDGVYLNGRKHKVPRYFDKLLDRLSPDIFRKVKYERIKDINSSMIADMFVHGVTNLSDMYDYNNRSYIGQMKDKLKKRSAV